MVTMPITIPQALVGMTTEEIFSTLREGVPNGFPNGPLFSAHKVDHKNGRDARTATSQGSFRGHAVNHHDHRKIRYSRRRMGGASIGDGGRRVIPFGDKGYEQNTARNSKSPAPTRNTDGKIKKRDSSQPYESARPIMGGMICPPVEATAYHGPRFLRRIARFLHHG
jgi:hypothetical protein